MDIAVKRASEGIKSRRAEIEEQLETWFSEHALDGKRPARTEGWYKDLSLLYECCQADLDEAVAALREADDSDCECEFDFDEKYETYEEMINYWEYVRAAEALFRGYNYKGAAGYAVEWRWDKNQSLPDVEISAKVLGKEVTA